MPRLLAEWLRREQVGVRRNFDTKVGGILLEGLVMLSKIIEDLLTNRYDSPSETPGLRGGGLLADSRRIGIPSVMATVPVSKLKWLHLRAISSERRMPHPAASLTINAITGSDSTSTSRCALTVSTVGAVGADDLQDGLRANEAGFDETSPRSMPL